MNEAKRIRSVSFRLTDEEYGEIEKAAAPQGMSRTTGAGSLPLRRLAKARCLARLGA